MRWSEAVTLDFVKIYLKHECLWNPDHPSYKMRHIRGKAYQAVCAEFNASSSKNFTVPEVRIKIKNLRTTYVQEVHKILQRSGPDSMYEPSLVWFHEMDRCLKHIPLYRHMNETRLQAAPEVDSSSQIWVDPETLIQKLENPDPLVSQTDETEEQSDEVNIKKERKPAFRKIKKRKFKPKTRNPVCYLSNSFDSNSHTREDEFDIYGKFIASQLRQMDLQKALRLQLEIQSLVSESRISEMS